jgi:hypothetical protein
MDTRSRQPHSPHFVMVSNHALFPCFFDDDSIAFVKSGGLLHDHGLP